MQVGVMSDSHDNIPNVKRAVALFNEIGVDLVVHAGDFIAPFAIDAVSRSKLPRCWRFRKQ